MMKRVALTVCLVCSLPSLATTFKDGAGLFNRRLGMFVHWGIYAVGEWQEQELWRKRTPRDVYENYRNSFTAEKFDADKFIDVAESAGAEYIVITAKHHDGFCMWDTKTTDYKVTNTPAKRDVLKELSEACRRRGMKLGLYYSNPDWHHPNSYNPESTHQIPHPTGKPDMRKYIEFVRAQITELLTNYGEICCLFWDIPTHVEHREMNILVRTLQPDIKIDDRGWEKGGDYSTPERGMKEGAAFDRLTEACDSIGAQSWGFRRNEHYRTLGYLTRAIDRTLTRGGNFLLNVGPKADGTIPEEGVEIFRKIGQWYAKVRESYREVEMVSGVVYDAGCMVTRRGNEVYLHYTRGLDSSGVDLQPYRREPQSAVVLNTGTKLGHEVSLLPMNFRHRTIGLNLWGIPADDLANESVVIKLVE